MKTALKRLTALCLIAIIGLSVTGCRKSKKTTDGSGSIEWDIEYVYEDDNDSTAQGGEDADKADTTGSGSTGKKDDTSKKDNTSKKDDGKTGSADPEKYRGTTVKFATWEKMSGIDADKVIANFKKKYGITVKIVEVNQGDYISIITSKIASGDAPDVLIDNGEFPITLSVMQPLNNIPTIDLSDSIWDKSTLDITTLNGKTYELSTVSCPHAETTSLFYFNKTLLKNAGCPMPDELYAKGQWTWDAMESIMKKYAGYAGKGNYGLQVGSDNTLLGTIGAGYYVYDQKTQKVINGMDSPLMVEALTRMSQWNKDGIATMGAGSFEQRKSAMIFDGLWGLKKNGSFVEMSNQNEIGVTYVPDYDANHKAVQSGGLRAWGICKGAKNPGGAGLFLRYYLDINNYDTSDIFISKEAETFFFKLNSQSASNKFIDCITGSRKIVGMSFDQAYYTFTTVSANTDPNQISAKNSALKPVITANCKKINDEISGWIK